MKSLILRILRMTGLFKNKLTTRTVGVLPLPLGGDSCMLVLRAQHPEARGHLSEALTEDTGVGNSVAGSPLPLTTGNENLDVAIVIHLQYCIHLIQVELLLIVDIIITIHPA